MKIDKDKIKIRETNSTDFNDIIEVQEAAFEQNDVVELTVDLLSDESAQPCVSLLALYKGEAVGHVLFTKASIEGDNNKTLAYILAPLAVIPEYQRQGIGGLLIQEGLKILREKGVKLVFVLGHDTYYPRHGFQQDAQGQGYPPTHPDRVPAEYAKYWMVQYLTDEELPKGKIFCAEAMDAPEYWRDDEVEIEM